MTKPVFKLVKLKPPKPDQTLTKTRGKKPVTPAVKKKQHITNFLNLSLSSLPPNPLTSPSSTTSTHLQTVQAQPSAHPTNQTRKENLGHRDRSEKSEKEKEDDKMENKKPEKNNKNIGVIMKNKMIKPEIRKENVNKTTNIVNQVKETCDKSDKNENEPDKEIKNENKTDKSTLKRSGDGKEIRVKVKGKITDIQTLKDFLSKAKAERAARGMMQNKNNVNSAESRIQPSEIYRREGSATRRESDSIANLSKRGTRNLTARGNQSEERQL